MLDLDHMARWDEAMKRLEAASEEKLRTLWRDLTGREPPKERQKQAA